MLTQAVINFAASSDTNGTFQKLKEYFNLHDLFTLSQGISVPEIVPSKFKDTDTQSECSGEDFVHPISAKSRRYVVGDRFHSATNPHKSPLCIYHDVNRCAQSNAIKTSYQESENNRKNNIRLRGSCMQNFHHHFFCNYLKGLDKKFARGMLRVQFVLIFG